MLHFSTPLRRLLPALILLSSLALTSCLEKENDPKPQHSRGKCGSPAPTTSTGTGGSN